MRLSVEQITTDAAFSALQAEWNPLLKQSANNEITLTWEWMDTWWSVFKDPSRHLFILTFREEDGHLVGIAPFQIRTVRSYPFLPAIVQIAFLPYGEAEADEICSDYLNFIISPGREAEVIAKTIDYLTNDCAGTWDEIVLDAISDDSKNLQLLREASSSHTSILYQEVNKGPSYFITLPDQWDTFLMGRSGQFRNQYRRHIKRAEKEGKLRYEHAQTPKQLEEGFCILASLHQMRWQERGEAGVFSSEKFLLFHKQFAERSLENGWVRLQSLYINTVPIAAIYNFFYNNKIYFYQSGIDEKSYKDIAPGTLMHGLCIEESIHQGIREYDFLFGTPGYKTRWTSTFRRLVKIKISSKSVNARLLRCADTIKEYLRTIYRKVKVGQQEPVAP